jgi:AcrR family transcriptional regulator
MKQKTSVKERILDTASRLFYHQGYNSTGINQIIAEAGIAIGSLYKHYPSKTDLLYHYLEQQEIEYFANLEGYLKEEKQPLQKLFKLIDYRIKIIVAHKQKQRDYIAALISEISTIQKLPMENNILENSIFLMIEGAIVSASIHGNTNDLKAVKETINQLF